MTPYLFLIAYAFGAIATVVRGPAYGLYLYVFAFYFSPTHTWWEDYVPELRYQMIAVVLTMISMVFHGTETFRERNRLTAGVRILTLLVSWIWLTGLWSYTGGWQLQGSILFSKHLFTAVLIVLLIKDLSTLRTFLLANVIGCAWLGWQAWGRTGGRLEGIAGALADANTLGMHMSAGLLLASMLFLAGTRIQRIISFLSIPLILNTIILTSSRGAFLGLLGGGLLAGWYCPRKLKGKFVVASCLACVLFLMLAHELFIERLMTLMAVGQDEAGPASGRFAIIQAQWEMFKDRPMGSGYKGTAVFSPSYMDPSMLSGGARSSHNSLMGLLVDFSVIGLCLYVALYTWMLRKLKTLKTWAEGNFDTERGAVIAGIAGAAAVVLVAGQTSNYYYAEIQYWLLALIACLLNSKERHEYEAGHEMERTTDANNPK